MNRTALSFHKQQSQGSARNATLSATMNCFWRHEHSS